MVPLARFQSNAFVGASVLGLLPYATVGILFFNVLNGTDPTRRVLSDGSVPIPSFLSFNKRSTLHESSLRDRLRREAQVDHQIEDLAVLQPFTNQPFV